MRKFRLITGLMVILAMVAVLAGCAAPPATPPSTTPAEKPAEETMPDKTIVVVATEAGQFTTLVAALKAAALVETLEGTGPFTVFAPDDAAFAKLPAGTVDTLLKEPTGDLTKILTYHVVPGDYPASALTDGMKLKTVQGEDITITIKDGKVYANEAMVTAADVTASNGVIHIVDSVLIPPSMK